ncbi:uncharacterized protein LOC129610420 [Condylostylus longicornis]|uniref:uncharacterized protein LOC129610420 n=1 Tax=Condylostylus longicornis TaxID=2530218 RepID=UPI00244DF4C6|nr:uncharacterized protein LOC129610420 [Condylostylus longicornis]
MVEIKNMKKIEPRRPIHKVQKISWRTYIEALRETFHEYTQWTQVVAISGLCPSRSPLERTINLIGLIILFLFSLYLSFRLWMHFFSSPTITSVGFSIPVKEVSFPAVTISFTFRKWQGSEIDISYKIVDEILALNNMNIAQVAKLIGASCEDFLEKCLWGSKQFDCYNNSEGVTFSSVMTTSGICCAFNYKPNNNSFVPLKARTYGMRGGLTIIGKSSSTGLYVFVHHPLDYPTDVNSRVTLRTKSENFVEVRSMLDFEMPDASIVYHDVMTSENLTDRNFIAKIYLKKQTALLNKKITVMSWLSFMADIGGVYGLCLGFNVISLLEAIYMLTIHIGTLLV